MAKKNKRTFKRDHEAFTPVQVIEQIVILIGFLAFLAGFWFLVYHFVKMWF